LVEYFFLLGGGVVGGCTASLIAEATKSNPLAHFIGFLVIVGVGFGVYYLMKNWYYEKLREYSEKLKMYEDKIKELNELKSLTYSHESYERLYSR